MEGPAHFPSQTLSGSHVFTPSPHKIILLKLIQLNVRSKLAPALQIFIGSLLVEQITHPRDITEPTLDELLATIEVSLPLGDHAQQLTRILLETISPMVSPTHLVASLIDILIPLCVDDTIPRTLSAINASHLLIEPSSVFSGFVASFVSALNGASFTVLMRLCKQMALYKQRGGTARRLLGPGGDANSLMDSSGYRGLRSPAESRLFLHREAENIESLVGTIPRHVITTKIERLASLMPNSPQVHFLSYLVCLHHGDYLGALDKLHQYFDHILIQQPAMSSSLLPYATLNLAAVHLRFGHIDEALELVREVTANVQRRKDDVCLARTLAILFRLSEQRCDSGYQLQLLQQTISRSLSLCIGNLSAQAMLDSAKHYLLHPREEFWSSDSSAQAKPEAVWRLIHACLSAATRADTPTESALLTSHSLLAAANTWEIYGNTSMSVLASQLQLNLQSSSSSQGLLSTPIGDQASVSQLGGSTSTSLSRGFDLVKLPNSDACASLLILARRANDLGDEREAISLLKEAYRLYPQPTSQSQWIRSARQILQECALRRGEVDAAEMQCIQLSALSPLNLDLQHHIDALYRLSLVLMERGHGTKSQVLLQSLIETCDGCGLSILCAGFRLTLAELLVRAGSPLNAIGPLLQALSLAQSFGLDTIRATAIVQLAHIHLLMATEADGNLHEGAGSGKKKTGKRHANIASSMLDGIMPHVLQHGSALLQAQARLESVKAIILTSATLDATGHSNAKDLKSSKSSENHAIWSSALEEVEDIIEIATKLNCKRLLIELFYFKARLEHAIGLHVQRNLTAKLFRALSLASSSSTTLDQILSSEGALTYLAEPHYTSTWNQYYLDASRPLL